MPACLNCGTSNPIQLAFCRSCGAALPTSSGRESTPVDERRRATVMFVDLSGWTSLVEQLDPEDVQAMAHELTQRMGTEVHRYGGTVISVMGDAIMAVFGAPVAHEDDAERAVRAGIAMRESIRSVGEHPSDVQLHIGINTGEGMAGLVGPEGRSDYTVVGDVTNTAARFQSAAAPGEILVGAETHSATSRSVEYADHAAITVKGKKEPLAVWSVIGIRQTVPERPGAGAPLVGRERELELLGSIWDATVGARHAQVVTVSGAPGIGKSRLIREAALPIERTGRFIKGRCFPYGETTGYGAFGQQVKQIAGILESDSESIARDSLDRHVRDLVPTEEVDEVAAHLSILLGFATERSADKQLLFFSVRRYVQALAQKQPTALVFEDLHWAEPTLLDLIQSLAARLRNAPLMLLTSARPEFFDAAPTWGSGLRYSAIQLEPLSEKGARRLARSLMGGGDQSEEAVQDLITTSGGNPLFLEELASSIAERATRPDSGLPSTIQSIIAARLDALPRHERSVLQNASVVGRIFWRGALAAIGRNGDLLDATLDSLEGRDLIIRQSNSRLAGDPEYLFKHILTREVAYDTLPRRSRRELHATVARYLEAAMGDRIRESASLLAHHWKEASEPVQAAPYLVEAAEVAARAWAKTEAIALFTEAIDLADQIDDQDIRARALFGRISARSDIGEYRVAVIDVEPLLAHPDLAVRAQAAHVRSRLAFLLTDAADVGTFADRARQMAVEIGDTRLEARAGALTGAAGWLAGDRATFLKAHARAAETWSRAERDADYAFLDAFVPLARYWDGRYEDGARLAREGYELGTELSSVYTMLFSVANLALNLVGLSRYEEAFDWLERGAAMGREWETTLQWTGRILNVHANALREVGDLPAARRLSEGGLEAGVEAGFLGASVSARIDLALTDLEEGEIGQAERQMPELLQAVEDFHGWHQWLYTGRLADLQALIALGSGSSQEAASKADEALRYLRRYPRPKYEARALTTRGEAMLALGNTEEALGSFRRSVELADGLRQAVLQWPALHGLATALERSGRQEEAEAASERAREVIEAVAPELAPERRSLFLNSPTVLRVIQAKR
jgi:class 3 adenylate cyclase/tetratricopeptide (TPR) repeat protein